MLNSKGLFLLVFVCMFTGILSAQTMNRVMTNPTMAEVLRGNYTPEDYQASSVLDHPDEIVPLIEAGINSDSLRAYLFKLNSFYTRNSGSDTMSVDTGIGAARNWILEKFEAFDSVNEGRLETGFLQFDMTICGVDRHKNVLAVLPGTVSNGEIVIIEGHMDSRCETGCDVECEARGMEDNGSGTALVIELARVMSQFTFEKTLVFMTTTAEEQGLFGAEAMAYYCKFDEPLVHVKAVLNNDVIGGIICGATSSEPSCPGENLIDSTQVRLFSRGGFNSPHKGLARYIKLQYEQELKPYVTVPMQLTLMTAEDRAGRGGDHIPFGVKALPAMRFTSAHEHGDAGIDADYHDRQHTSEDVLGIDTNADGVIDSFYVDFNYLARNARINGTAAAMIAISPEPISFETEWTSDDIFISIIDGNDVLNYAIGVRTLDNDFDTIHYVTGAKEFTIPAPDGENAVRLSVAAVDENEIESCFSEEIFVKQNVATEEIEVAKKYPLELWQNAPNPFDEATSIAVLVNRLFNYSEAFIMISTMEGKLLERITISMNEGVNEVLYRHGYGTKGVLNYSLVIDGDLVETKRMIFAN